MMAAIMMMTAFLVLTGAALLYCNLLKMNIGEGMVMSAASLILLIYLSGRFTGRLTGGKTVFILLGAAGVIYTAVNLYKKKFDMGLVRNIYWPALTLILIAGIILYAGDYIRYIDEFHMWAAAPKYMIDNNALPLGSDFIGGTDHHIGTSLFHYFFQSFTGFNEGMMYTSSALLVWIGLLLPLGNMKGNHWKDAVIYILVLYFGIFSFYLYGTKNLYVDLPAAGWAGGMAAWLPGRTRKKPNILLLVTVISMVYYFKDWAGLLLGLFLVLLYLIRVFLIEKVMESKKILELRQIIGGCILALPAICLAGGLILFGFLWDVDISRLVPEPIRNDMLWHGYSTDKVHKTLYAFLSKATGTGLSEGKSFLKVPFFGALILCVFLLIFYGIMTGKRRECLLYISFILSCSVIFSVIVLLGFMVRISYIEATKLSGGARYFSIYALFAFIISLSLLIFSEKRLAAAKITRTLGLALMCLFVYGVTENYLAESTSWNLKNGYNYDKIIEQRSQVDAIHEITAPSEKVYFLNQKSKSTDDFGNNPALFYMGSQMSNTREVPWKFTLTGSVVRIDDNEYYKITDLPELLSSGDYTYLWIYKTDDYLNRNLPKVLDMDRESFAEASKKIEEGDGTASGTKDTDSSKEKGKDGESADQKMTATDKADEAEKNYEVGYNPAGITDGQLYKVIYDDEGGAKGLTLEQNLKPYDIRAEHKTE